MVGLPLFHGLIRGGNDAVSLIGAGALHDFRPEDLAPQYGGYFVVAGLDGREMPLEGAANGFEHPVIQEHPPDDVGAQTLRLPLVRQGLHRRVSGGGKRLDAERPEGVIVRWLVRAQFAEIKLREKHALHRLFKKHLVDLPDCAISQHHIVNAGVRGVVCGLHDVFFPKVYPYGLALNQQAELSIQTEQFDESRAALNKLVADCGGYFEVASDYGGSYRDAYANRSGEYTIRVPAEKYSQFFNSAGDLGYITNSTESSEDVGERYYDTETRLKTQRTKQERLLALLEKAETMEDIISLENALSDVEYQIEQYSSELNRYDALVGFSTFNIYLNEVGRVTEEVGETASLGQRMAAGFQASVRGLSQGFQNFLIWASYNVFLLVVLAAVAVVAVVVGKRELKKIRKQNEKKSEEN